MSDRGILSPYWGLEGTGPAPTRRRPALQETNGGTIGGTVAAKLFVWYWVPVLAYAGVIFSLSSLSRPEELMPSMLEEVGDKTLHALEYGVLGILCYRALRRAAGAWGAAHALPLSILVAVLYGMTDEVHQAFVPTREADPLDLLADGIGATVLTWSWHKLDAMGWRRKATREGRGARG